MIGDVWKPCDRPGEWPAILEGLTDRESCLEADKVGYCWEPCAECNRAATEVRASLGPDAAPLVWATLSRIIERTDPSRPDTAHRWLAAEKRRQDAVMAEILAETED
jgi:hypothetical protein